MFQSGGLKGEVFQLKDGAGDLPNFKKLQPIATVYTYSLNIPTREFSKGFPGVPDVFEWFAIQYTGRIWIEREGEYRFYLSSDDGSRLFIDDKKVVDNNGTHALETRDGTRKLKRGVHDIRLEYFQGPRFHVALILEVEPPGQPRHVFDMREFGPSLDALDSGAFAEPSK